MKRLLCLSPILLFLVASVAAHSGEDIREDKASIEDRLVGAWRLASLEEPDADGKIRKTDCTGLLVYSRDGHMSVQVMYRNVQGTGGEAPARYAQGGYEASFGTYKINDAHRFTFHVEGALVRTLIGKELVRVYELSGNQLSVKSPNPEEHWRALWERY